MTLKAKQHKEDQLKGIKLHDQLTNEEHTNVYLRKYEGIAFIVRVISWA